MDLTLRLDNPTLSLNSNVTDPEGPTGWCTPEIRELQDSMLEVILIRVVVPSLIESYMDWIDLGTLGPLGLVGSCNVALGRQPKGR